MLRLLFENFRCMVRVGNSLSEPFLARQGIHQGSSLSMYLYMVFNNGLIKELNDNFFNPTFCKIRIGAIAYADDIALVSRSIYGIQSLVSRAHNHSKKWRYDFNASKGALLMFPKNVKENVNV